MRMSRCKSCNREIVWIKMKSGKAMPVDVPALTVITEDGDTIKAYTSHFATCPNANQHRKAAR